MYVKINIMFASLFILVCVPYFTNAHGDCPKPCEFSEHCADNPCHDGVCGSDEYCYVHPCKCTHRCLKKEECMEDYFPHCEPDPCKDVTPLPGFQCIVNSCDCSYAIVGAEPFKCDPQGGPPCPTCSRSQKCVRDPVNCNTHCAETNPAPCSTAICKQADCKTDEECYVDYYVDKCHARCREKDDCDSCDGQTCSLTCSNPLLQRCAFTECTCEQFCETCQKSTCQPFVDNCATDPCSFNTECIEDICGCRSSCQACPDTRCTTFDNKCNEATTSGCTSTQACDNNKCTCERECQECDETRCMALYGRGYDNAGCPGGCGSGQRCERDACGCEDKCVDCTCNSFTNNCQNPCPTDQACLPDPDLCTCQRTCQTCTLSQCSGGALDTSQCTVDENCSPGEICQENICNCETTCFDCCGTSKDLSACNGCNDCRPTDEGDYCTTCLWKCFDDQEPDFPFCIGQGTVDEACGTTTTIFCKTANCGMDNDCCDNLFFCNPNPGLYLYAYDKVTGGCNRFVE